MNKNYLNKTLTEEQFYNSIDKKYIDVLMHKLLDHSIDYLREKYQDITGIHQIELMHNIPDFEASKNYNLHLHIHFKIFIIIEPSEDMKDKIDVNSSIKLVEAHLSEKTNLKFTLKKSSARKKQEKFKKKYGDLYDN